MSIQVDTSRDDQSRVIRVGRRLSRRSDGALVSEFIEKACDRYRTVVNAESRLRQDMKSDLEFRASEQWDPQVKADRATDGRPCLTINRLPQFIRQVTNQLRASRPAIQVNPVDSGSDPAVAEALQGIIRNIEMNSDADIAYATAAEFQVTCGRGYWLVTTEFADDDQGDQVIAIRTIKDPLSVFVDPTMPDQKDKRYGFIIEDIPKDTFEERYGEAATTNYQAWLNSRARSPEWMPEGRMRVAHYFYLETETEDTVDIEMPSLDNPQVRETVRIPKELKPKDDEMPKGWVVKGERTLRHSQCKWALITPVEVLDGNDDLTAGREFPSKYVPIVEVLGDELNIDGEVDLRGMVRDAKDPQKMYSFWASALTEVIALSPRAPYIGYEGSFKGHEAKWNMANRKNYAYLEVNPVTVGGQPAPFPQRQQFEPAIQAIVEAFQLADNDLKAVTGLYDASLGKSGPEQSGKAILARKSQGDLGNSNFADNVARAIRHTGRILLDMIPRVYTPVKIFRILGADNQTKKIAISSGPMPQDTQAAFAAQGVSAIYDVSIGRYDIALDVANRQTQRQEAVEALLQLINSYPNAAPIISDLLVKNMDWPGAAEISARLRRTVPSNIRTEGEGGGPAVPPDVVKHIQDLTQQVQELTTKLQSKQYEVDKKFDADMVRIDSNDRAVILQEETKRMVADMKANIEKASSMMEQSISDLDSRFQRSFQLHDAEQQRIHDAEQADKDRAHQAEVEKMKAQQQPANGNGSKQ
jgi:hypothetical protein